MSNFRTKLRICLTEPRKLGFFMGEKKWKTLIQLFLVLLIALTPYLIKTSLITEISSSSKSYLETILMTENINEDIKIIDGKLIGDETISVVLEEGIIFINPLNQTLVNDEYKYLPIYNFHTDGVTISLLDVVLSELTYEELGYLNIDFNKIFDSNYIEYYNFVGLINDSFSHIKAYLVTLNFLSMLVVGYLSLILSASIIAFFGGMTNKLIAYRFRFKGALDAQFISVLFIFLAYLFNIQPLEYVGTAFSIIYFMRGLMSIVRIEVKRIKKEGQ